MVLTLIRLIDHPGHPLDTTAKLHTEALISLSALITVDEGIAVGVSDRAGQVLGQPEQYNRVEDKDVH